MEENLKISILMTSFNYENYIKEAIESVIKQTYSNWELIIVDDGSKDNSIEVINSYCSKDNRIKLFQHENGINKGLKDSILFGLQQCKTDWVAFLESDDVFVENALEEKIKIIKENLKVDFIFSDVEMIGERDIISDFDGYFSNCKKLIFNSKLSYQHKLLKMDVIPTFSVVMTKKEKLMECDFGSPVKSWLDYYLWIQISSNSNMFYIDKKLTKWRMHSKSYTERIDYKKTSNDKFIFELKKANTIFKETSNFFLKFLCFVSMIKAFKKWFLRLRLFKNPSICFCGTWYFLGKKTS